MDYICLICGCVFYVDIDEDDFYDGDCPDCGSYEVDIIEDEDWTNDL